MLKGLITPKKLSLYMQRNIDYGYFTKYGKIEKENYDNMYTDYRLQTPKEVLNNKIGLCWDQVEFERYIFEKMIKLPIKTFYIEQKNENQTTHTFLVFYENNKMHYFENAYWKYKGIRIFNNINDIINTVRCNMKKDENDNGAICYEYSKPKYHISVEEYMNHAKKQKPVKVFR